jgi:hypothetical protein
MRIALKFIVASCLLALVAALPTLVAQSQAQDAAPADGAVQDDKAAEEPDATPEQIAELERTLSGAALVGHFTIGGGNEGGPREERYELGEVKHLEGNKWLISARIRYGDNDVTIPLTLPIRWAGNTPVITVDDMGFPGLGTYTARVMIYDDHYAGYWAGADHGGHLFGKLERAKADADNDQKDDAESAKK